MKIDFANLQLQYQAYKKEIDANIQNVLNKSNYILGEEVQTLEQELQKFTGAKYAITCSSVTDALLLALMAIDIEPGDEVITTPFTWISTGEMIALLKAKPVFVDIEPDTYNIDANLIEKAITKKTKAIMPVSLYGQPADMDVIQAIADKHNLKVIIGGAQSFGSTYNNKTDSNLGDISTTSFFPSKPLGCYGDGGAIFTDNDNLASLLRSLRVHGKGEDKYDNIRIGYNSRLDTLQAAILNVKFNAFEKYELRKVNEVAQEYNRLLFNIVATPYIPSGYYSSYAQYTIILESNETRDGLKKYLEKSNIPTFIYYNKPLHRQKAFDSLHISDNNLENSIQLSDRVLSLPMHPYLKNSEIKFISTKVIEFLNK